MTEPLFKQDAYLKETSATVVEVNDRGGIVLDRSIFYPTGGGQPGDKGTMSFNGNVIEIATTVNGSDKIQIIHVPASQDVMPEVGDEVQLTLDWETRYKHMRVHTMMHLMCSLVPFPVTGGQVGADGGRLDFDVNDPSKLDKEQITAALNKIVEENHATADRWISDEEMEANPQLVRTMSVKPPMGLGKVRLLAIGEDGVVDLQPCGGTHVKSTGEIGPVVVSKIQNKGKQNRRIRVDLI
ncbi:Ser-tRNA(Ala) deacylase @ Gly-tRNA(Ala) deacylase [hydrothermal vent metagenome]|uniref:Ser-tRNA(Ala) deacylase @ Gly-tRNA(Ala) deacylase n=1 Tax=hydrothermal vent metagenome TaxID=652676 RepID=A0A3B0R7D4_9ZZZZ